MKVCVSIYTTIRSVGYPNPPKVRIRSEFASERKLRKFANANSTPEEDQDNQSTANDTTTIRRSSITYRKYYELSSKEEWSVLLNDLRNWESSIDNVNRGYRIRVQEFKDSKNSALSAAGYAGKELRKLPSRDADSIRRKLRTDSFMYTRVQYVLAKSQDDQSDEDFGTIKSKVGHYLTGFNPPAGFVDTQHESDSQSDS